MQVAQKQRRARCHSYIEIRLMMFAGLVMAVLMLSIPALLRAIDVNGDNLDDEWEARYGISTTAYAFGNLVGWWQMNGPTDVADRSTNQINGRLVNFATNAPFSQGLFSNALYFTPEAYVDFPTNAALNTPNGMTFSAWIKTPDNATNAATIATWLDAQTNSWSVGIAPGGIASITFANSAGNGQTVGPTINTATLYDGQWHHLAATWAPGQQARVYVDGEIEGSSMITNWAPGPVASFNLGASDDSVTNQPFLLDETRLYNRALEPHEITQLPITYSALTAMA